jgi:acyl-CoA-binding protein
VMLRCFHNVGRLRPYWSCARILSTVAKYRRLSSGLSSFQLAQTRVQELREEPDNDTKLKLYALYKQVSLSVD